MVRGTQWTESIATTGVFLGLKLPNILQKTTKRGFFVPLDRPLDPPL